MDVRCNRCGTEYELDEARVAVAGTTVKCSNCGHIFKVLPGGEVREGSGAHAASTRQPTSETRLPNVALSSMPSTNPGQATSTNASSLPSNVTTTPPATTGEWMVRKVDGQIFRFRELTTLQKWIVERKVGRDDEISRTARTWKKLGEIAELTSFFQVVEAADAAQRPITASQLPQVQLSATPTGTFSAIPMPIPASISTPPQPAFPEPEPRRDSRSFAPAPVAFTPSPLTATNPVQPLDDDPVMRWQRRRTAIVRTAVAAAAGLVGVAAIAYALNHRTPTTLPPALREQVQLALTRGDDAARKVAMSALASSTVTAAPAVRARLQAEGARALNEALRLSDEAVGTAVANAAPGVVAGTPPPPAPP
ncbi:MAG TPA: zinc-ribbon domain-containing protein, partial [Myxococcota bacterium]